MSVIVIGAEALAADLVGAGVRFERNATTALAVTARKVQQSARQRVSGRRYLPQYPQAITYDVKRAAGGPQAEIGPDKGRPQGALGNLVEYGSIHNAPIEHLGPALEENADDAVRGIEIAVWQALR